MNSLRNNISLLECSSNCFTWVYLILGVLDLEIFIKKTNDKSFPSALNDFSFLELNPTPARVSLLWKWFLIHSAPQWS